MFREASGDRQLLCALQNRCSICASTMDEDEVWHVVDEPAAKRIGYALRRGAEPATAFLTYEVPGHYACMLYAAAACPFLATPTARRGLEALAPVPGVEPVAVGTSRGVLSGLVGFRSCTVEILAGGGYEVELLRPHTIHTYRAGAELLPLLREAIATEPSRVPPPAELFGPSDRAVHRELRRALA